jgi:hypothetical protein
VENLNGNIRTSNSVYDTEYFDKEKRNHADFNEELRSGHGMRPAPGTAPAHIAVLSCRPNMSGLSAP